MDCYLIVQITMAVVTAAMAVATAIMAVATRASVKEMREERIERLAPRVLVYFEVEPFHSIINLVVANSGQGVARNVRISLDKPLLTSRGSDVATCTLLRDGIPCMPPGQIHKVFVDVAPSYFAKGLPEQFRVATSYETPDGSRRYEDKYTLDLSHWKDYGVVRPKTQLETLVERLAKAVEKLRP